MARRRFLIIRRRCSLLSSTIRMVYVCCFTSLASGFVNSFECTASSVCTGIPPNANVVRLIVSYIINKCCRIALPSREGLRRCQGWVEIEVFFVTTRDDIGKAVLTETNDRNAERM